MTSRDGSASPNRWWRGPAGTAALGGVLAIVAAGATFAATGAPWSTASTSGHDATPVSTVSSSTSPSVSPDRCPECAPYDPPSLVVPASFDDGIDPSSLPPLAPRPSDYHPPAHQMEPWVWDYVGPGWGVAFFTDFSDAYRWSYGGVEEAYLVSPEGVFFDLYSIPRTSYGSFVEWADLDRREILVDVSDEGGSWEEWVDLATGRSIREFDSYEEGGGLDAADVTFNGFVGDRSIRRRVADPETLDFLPEPEFAIVDVDGAVTPLDPPASGYDIAGGQLPRSYDDGLLDEALFVAGPVTAPGANAVHHAYALDVAAGTYRSVMFPYPSGLAECSAPGPLVAGVAYISCTDPADSVHAYRVHADGRPPVEVPFAANALWRGSFDAGYVDAWTHRGFEPVFSEWNHVTDIYDVSGGARTLVLHDDAADTVEGRVNPPPTEIRPGLFVIEATDSVMGYDRSTGETFFIVPAVFSDTEKHNGMNSYAPLWSGG